MTLLGTDGFGRSSHRSALRKFFEVDHTHIALAALDALSRDGTIQRETVRDAVKALDIDANAPPAWQS